MNGTTVRRALREIALVAALFLAYKMGRLLVDGHVTEAMNNASAVWHFERVLHLPSEAGLQTSLLSHEWWVRVANCFYAYVHFPATAIALIWMYVRKPETYLWMRRTLATLTAFALVIHAVFPLAPPRMLGSAGLVDTGRLFGPSVYGPPDTDTLSNQYAAMPSLHVGWAIVVALALMTTTAGWKRWLWLAHPAITLIVVVVTGNHYWLDAIAVMGLIVIVGALVPRAVAAPVFIPAQRLEPAPVSRTPSSRPRR
ncbi:phosphatase PAP2 family protein [Paractinoplanes maris]|uniref:phosphatase PAP2 family protein n=1 Tax=Paractinoplanes maris TaxID=1734446 RepID=UPI00202078D2|nr:phosphatase PAP2 family protein [Actinoplanes maris]